MTTQAQLLQAALRTHFPVFLEKAFSTLDPGKPFIPGWHLKAIAYQLERVRKGECKRLIINLPPRSLKSIMISVAWPAFLHGQDPKLRIICASYARDLATKLSNDYRALIKSDWYRQTFPGTRIGSVKDTQDEVELTARGFRLATSVGGTLTGRGGDIIIIDDPLKPTDALSASARTATNEWYASTLRSRLDTKVDGAIVIVMQRVHMDDLTGYVLQNGGDWTVLSLPAIATNNDVFPLYNGSIHHRRVDNVLSPEREPYASLMAAQREIGGDVFSAQYQQAPVPPGGAMIKRDWVQRYTELPPLEERLCIVQSWDTANKGGPDNDFSVCTTWQQTTGARWYLVDVWRARVDYPTLRTRVQSMAAEWQAAKVLVEESGTAIGLLAELQSLVPGIIGIKPDRDKASRISVASAQFEAKQVFFPERAPWLPELEAELFSFPGGSHDDQVDSISQALLHGKDDTDYELWNKLARRGPIRLWR